MKTKDFSFELPSGLIAQEPASRRGDSRLMVLDRSSSSVDHKSVSDLPAYVEPGTVMVFNDSRVRKARLFGTMARGRAMDAGNGREREFLLTERLSDGTWDFISQGKSGFKEGSRISFPEGMEATITRNDGKPRLVFGPSFDEAYLERVGHVPLPPYIKRPDGKADAERYQTVYARSLGSSAAPTAGLHFTDMILSALAERGVLLRFVTLHVGLGTFLPVRTEDIERHEMHEEAYDVPEDTARDVSKARAEGRKILAVGTTSLRTLESAWTDGALEPGAGRTRIFIAPGYSFKAVDALFTNFHTPESTLLMLVSAFAGREFVLDAYAKAVDAGYRFFSYGDAMLIL
jgi:S-adenosylmethionine:tRNA ribosyltransferase-isomerase